MKNRVELGLIKSIRPHMYIDPDIIGIRAYIYLKMEYMFKDGIIIPNKSSILLNGIYPYIDVVCAEMVRLKGKNENLKIFRSKDTGISRFNIFKKWIKKEK